MYMVQVISVTRGGVKFSGKKHYVTLEWPINQCMTIQNPMHCSSNMQIDWQIKRNSSESRSPQVSSSLRKSLNAVRKESYVTSQFKNIKRLGNEYN